MPTETLREQKLLIVGEDVVGEGCKGFGGLVYARE
jgi:hypothetical protein